MIASIFTTLFTIAKFAYRVVKPKRHSQRYYDAWAIGS